MASARRMPNSHGKSYKNLFICRHAIIFGIALLVIGVFVMHPLLQPKMIKLATFVLGSLALTRPSYAAPAALETRLPGRVAQAEAAVVADTNGRYFRVSSMNDGSMIGGYAKSDGSQTVLRVVQSTDGAASWEPLGEVARAEVATHEIDNAFPLQSPGGRIVYAFRNHDKVNGNFTHYRITMSYSDDGGKSFKFLSQVDERPATTSKNGLWEPFLRLANDGTLQCYYSSENANNDQDNLMKYSKDGGKTWSDAITVSGKGVTSRDGMTGVAPIDDNGNLICVFENTEDGPLSIRYVLSHDDGYSWGERTHLYTASGNKTRTAIAPQAWNIGGTLVVSFMTNEDTSDVHSDGAQMKVITSIDRGQSWSDSVVTATHAHWPGLFKKDNTHFLALYGKDGAGLVSQSYALVH